MTETILAAAVAIITAPLSALLTAIFLRSKHNAEVDKLRAEVKQTLADVRGRELDNDKNAIKVDAGAAGTNALVAVADGHGGEPPGGQRGNQHGAASE